MVYPIVRKIQHLSLTVTMADISTASSVFIPMIFRGRVVAASVTIQNAITGSDSALTGKINGVAITGFTGTAAVSGSAAGTVFAMGTPTAAYDVINGDVLELITDGASSTTAIATWNVVIHTY